MWNDRLRFAGPAASEWSALSQEERDVLHAALERLDDDPILGVPLFPPLRGCWSYRVGKCRIVYRLSPEARMVLILKLQAEVESPL